MLEAGVTWGLILVSSAVLLSCGSDSCTDIGCTGLTVAVRPASTAWQPGEYQLELTLDDGSRSCSFVLPDDLAQGSSNKRLDCGSHVFPELGQQALQIRFSVNPERLGLRLLRDGDVVLSSDGAPPYEKFYPNGRDCGVCWTASMELTVED